MCSWREVAGALLLTSATGLAQAQAAQYSGVGRAATPQEIAAWDIDVRPDFQGLPKGSGSVRDGMAVWEGKCASCHGVFGESNAVFNPLVGGTTSDDVAAGRVARLTDPGFPFRTTLMKLASVATLWDYIRRAMPWAEPKSLRTDEVYAVTAYLLNLGSIVADDFILSERTIAQAQALLPNRKGLSTEHAMWPGTGPLGEVRARRPVVSDVRATPCMKNCAPAPSVASFFPDFARDSHGNLAQQNRSVGAQQGVGTTPVKAPPPGRADSATPEASALVLNLLQRHGCVACHGIDRPLIGPSFRDVARKYANRADASSYLAEKVRSGGSGTWGAVPMPAQTLAESDAKAISQWLAGGALQ